jgi:glutathione-regulated potassium-efflux system protein KefB
MSLDLSVIAADWPMVLLAVVAYMAVKASGIYVVARLFRSSHADALQRALLLAQGGEFAFVLYTAAGTAGLFEPRLLAILGAAVIISMALTPLAPIVVRLLLPKPKENFDGVEKARGLSGTVLLVGFGRFGQIAAQFLVARGVDLTVIDSDTDMIRSAARFGAKIYYGDGTRLDVLRASGAGTAKAIIVAIDDKEAATRITELVRETFPLAQLFVRAYDRGHAISLVKLGVDYYVRETFESAMALGEAILPALGFSDEEAAATAAEVRRRDNERLRLQILEGSDLAGRDFTFRPGPVPVPLTPPKSQGRALNEETAVVTDPAAGEPAEPAGR